MNRRNFVGLLTGAAAAWPVAARAQQPERTRRICVLMSTAVNDPQDPARLAAFAQGLQELGWTIGRNLRIDYRWGASSPVNTRKYAAELAALAPDVMLASGAAALAAVQQTSPTIPATVRRRYLWHMSESGTQGPLPDDKLVAEIKAVIAELPTYGYRRVHAILKRQALAAGLKPPNHKRVYRVMKVHGLLLDRHAGGVERRHHGRIAVDARELYEVRWAARRCYRRNARPHGISLSVCRRFEVAAQISRESR